MKLLKWLCIYLTPVWALIAVILFEICYQYIFKKRRFKKRNGKVLKNRGFFRRLFIDFPKRFVEDLYNRNPNCIPEYGFHIICGEQGSGKSLVATYLLNEYKRKYPDIKIRTNYNYKYQDEPITHWKQLIFSNNGEIGEVDVLDEVQNWLSSNESKDFPVDLLQEVTQLRKQRKLIIGTAQVFERVSKPLREQAMIVYKPITVLGCLTIVRKYKPLIGLGGTIKKMRLMSVFFFVHDDYLRNSYDTYNKIKRLVKKGYDPLSIKRVNEDNVVLSAEIDKKLKL